MNHSVRGAAQAHAETALADRMAHALRFLTVDAVAQAKSGHPGMPMGMADVAAVLFTRILKYDPQEPRWPDRDRFVLSVGHGSMLLYGLLYLAGYPDITLDDIRAFRQLGAKTAGHPEYGNLAGIETTTGPLGQGFANAVGMALAERMMEARFGSELVDHYTYVMAGDGCLMEGISQEALTLAAHLKLGRLICLFDDNGVTIDGGTDHATSENQLARFQAAGWDVRVVDGHDRDQVEQAIRAAKSTAAPSLIACKTAIGFGSPERAGKPAAHYGALAPADDAAMRENLGWQAAPFEVPQDVLDVWRAAGARGGADRQAWQARLAAAPAGMQAEFTRRIDGELPEGWRDTLAGLKRKAAGTGGSVATRMVTGDVLSALAPQMPELAGGSADLAGSTLTWPKGFDLVTASAYGGRYIPFGVREHAMGAVMNGLALHGGFIPYGGTFLCFIDYARPALRLSALMGQRVVYVMTHDSVAVGEDGPTHQPVEHLAGLRAMPNLQVLRPCDAVEAVEAWELALAAGDRPTVLCLSRGELPVLRDGSAENRSARGGYILREAEGEARVTLVATGSEVSIAAEARDLLQADGIPTALVSMPCWSLFDAQPQSYRDAVLRPDSTAHVSVEAQSTLGWERYIGRRGIAIGMKSFGESGPADELMAHFGFSPNAVADAARRLLEAG